MKISKSFVAIVATVSIAAGLGAVIRFEPSRAHAGPAAGSVPEEVLSSGTIADVAEGVVESVVNISSSHKAAEAAPEEIDPFFQYFGIDPGGGGGGAAGISMGSGVIVTAQGRVLTNAHVINGADEIKVTMSDGTELDAKLLGVDPRSDVAVLQLEGDLPKLKPIRIGDSTKLRLGEVVLAIGNPFAVGQSVTMGIVSAKGRATGGTDYQDFIQTDAAINPGNSGGALVNLAGELVGINTAILSHSGGYEGIGFAIPSAMASPIMDMLVKNGKVSRGYLGVNIATINKAVAKDQKLSTVHGVLITGVEDKSPAAKAGIVQGDVVVSLDGSEIRDANKLRNTIAMRGAGKTAELAILRGKDHSTVKVVLGELPDQTAPTSVKPTAPKKLRIRPHR
jgi:serine protease Do